MANVSVSVQERLYFKLKQIERDEYNWLTEGIVSQCTDRLESVLYKDCNCKMPNIEETIIHQGDDKAHVKIDEFFSENYSKNIRFRFTARTDVITENTLWEMKCTGKITIDNKLQLIIYAWLWKMRVSLDTNISNEKQFKLFNIKTNELFKLEATDEELNQIMLALIRDKFQETELKVDDEFISDCKSYLNKLCD